MLNNNIQTDLAFWMQIVVNNNYSNGYPNFSLGNGTWKEYNNNTAVFSGRVTSTIDANVSFDLSVTFNGRSTGLTPH